MSRLPSSAQPKYYRSCEHVLSRRYLPRIKASSAQRIIDTMRGAWKAKKPLPFLLAYIKMVRLCLDDPARPRDVLVINEGIFLAEIHSAMNGPSKKNPYIDEDRFFRSNYLTFLSGTAGERWYFKNNQDGKMMLVLFSGGSSKHIDRFLAQLRNCQGVEFAPEHNTIIIKLS